MPRNNTSGPDQYYTGSPSVVPTKETDVTYSTMVNGAYFPSYVDVLDSNGYLAAQTTFYYDQGTPAAAPGATNLVAAPGGSFRGNLTHVTSGIGSNIVQTSATYDVAGQKLTDVDGNLS